MSGVEVKPIGAVRSPRKDLNDDFWGAVEAKIVLDDALGPEALYGLSDFSMSKCCF